MLYRRKKEFRKLFLMLLSERGKLFVLYDFNNSFSIWFFKAEKNGRENYMNGLYKIKAP